MAFIRRVRTASGATAVQIAEYAGGRQRIVKHVGSAHTEAELGVLLEQARALLEDPSQEVFDLDVEPSPPVVGLLPAPSVPGLFPPVEAAPAPGGRDAVGRVVGTDSRVLFDALAGVYTDLGFDAVGDEVFRDLVVARVVEPTSLLDAGRVLTDLGRVPASYATMKRTLERAGAGKYRDQLATLCFTHALTSGDVSLCLYDVTTLYFEAEKEDDLRKVGFSKERRVDPQIVVGLLVDRYGFPLEIGCFEGSKAETKTILPVIEQFQARHGIEGMVVVTDAGMLSATNLRELDEAGFSFNVGSRLTKAPIDLESHFRWHGDAFTDGQVIDTITPKTGHRSENNRMVRAEPVWDRAHPDRAGEPRPRGHRRGESDPDPEVRQDHEPGAEPGRSLSGPRPQARRVEGVRHQHPRDPHATRGSDLLLPRPVARGAVLPDEQDGPARPADLPPHQRRDRRAPDHRVHRVGYLPHRAVPDGIGAAQRPETTPAAALRDHRDQRHHPDLRPRHPHREADHPRRHPQTGSHALNE